MSSWYETFHKQNALEIHWEWFMSHSLHIFSYHTRQIHFDFFTVAKNLTNFHWEWIYLRWIYVHNKANLRDLIAATSLVILLKLELNLQFLSPCDLEIWWMTPKNNRAHLLCYFKLFASFRSHWWIQTGVTVQKRLIWVKIDTFLSRVTLKFDGWPSTRQIWGIWKLRMAYSPETPNLGQNLWCFVPCEL